MKCLETLTLNQTCKRTIVLTGITYYRVNLSRTKFSVILEMSNVLEKVKKSLPSFLRNDAPGVLVFEAKSLRIFQIYVKLH